MRRSLILIALLAAAGAVLAGLALTSPRRAPILREVGPRLVSNQTSQPLTLYGEGFEPGMVLVVSGAVEQELPVQVADGTMAFARLPAGLSLSSVLPQAQLSLHLKLPRGDPSAKVALTLVNDAAFPDLVAMAASRDGQSLAALSTTTDELFLIRPGEKSVRPLKTHDGPTAVASYVDPRGAEWFAVAHRFSPVLALYRVDDPGASPRLIEAPSYAVGLAVAGKVAYVAEHARDTVSAIELETGRVLWRTGVAPNPKALAVAGDRLLVGSQQTGELEVLALDSGRIAGSIAPGPTTPIVGGKTEAWAKYAMGGTAPRAIVWSPKLGRAFVSSIGPNIGPNPDRMEVSMNGGVGVVSLSPAGAGSFDRHRGFGQGVTEALLLDDARDRVYATDVALGLVRVLDASKLAASDSGARGALLAELPIPPPPGFPTVRPASELGLNDRAGMELHSGPAALALSPDGRTLFALDRFTGTLAALDVSDEGLKRGAPPTQIKVVETLAQKTRRLGQVLYFTDVGHSAMSCDACHLEGHTMNVFFAKTFPLRIYRSPTLRGVRETPPYFTPASARSLAETTIEVGGRNRYHNPDPSPSEVEALSLFTSEVAPLPNPYRDANGAPPATLELPDGKTGSTRRGRELFQKGCAGCHPAPLFTTDQDAPTRGRFLDVGTPHALPLREAMQDTTFKGFAPPSLLGAWDVFPMLTTGSAGLEVREDGTLHARDRFPLRAVLERYSGPSHGNAESLTQQERDDLLAWLLTL